MMASILPIDSQFNSQSSFQNNYSENYQIVVYTDAAGIGGAEISLRHLVATASPRWQITVVGVAEPVVTAIAAARPQVQSVVLPQPGSLYQHWRCFRQMAPQLIHFNCCTPWANRVALLAGLLHPQIKLVRVDQLPLRTTDLFTLWQIRALCLRLDGHVAVGQASARRMEDFYALGRNSVLSIPNGVPDQPAANLSRLSRSIVPALTVGSVGRLDAMKGHDLLLRAIAQVEGLHLVILGEGSQRRALEQLAQELQIIDRVELKGWVENPRDFLPSFDLVALPSRSEGFPLVMVEAMLAARPLVATRVGSVPEAIIPGETGLLIEKDDLAGLVAALQQLRDQPELRSRLGQNAQVLARRHWTVESMTHQYEQLWETLIAAPAKSRLRVPRPRD